MHTPLYFKVPSSARRMAGLLAACTCWLYTQSQQVVPGKSPLQLADQYFAAGEYYTAAHLYDQYLNPSRYRVKSPAFPVYAKKGATGKAPQPASREDVLYKQAESYRLAHYWENADSAYKQCTGKPDALYWSAVCERSLGKYNEAEENIRKYLSAGNSSAFREAAEKELQTLQYIHKQLSRADAASAQVSKLNIPASHEKGAFAVVPVGGDQYLVSSTQTTTAASNKDNPHQSRLFYATLNNDSLSRLTAVAFPAGGMTGNQGAASIGANGQYMYFTQWKKENGITVSNIYYAVKQKNNSWSAPVVLPQVNSSGYNSKQPFCTADGKYLFFASDRPGGSGGFDIWYVPLQGDSSTGEPVNAGARINTAGDEQAPFYHTSSGTLVFSTNGMQGMGGYDLFAAKGHTTTWSLPNNMGHPVNSSRDDVYFFAPEQTPLLAKAIVGSDRGSGCCLETYRITKTTKNKLLTGLVLDSRNNTPVADVTLVFTHPSGHTHTITTDIDGKYVLDTLNDGYKDYTIGISKSSYEDTSAIVKIAKTDDTDQLTDRLFNEDLFIQKKLIIKAENVITVFFDFDKSNLKQEEIAKLDSMYDVLAQFPNATLQISGYTDGKGTDEYNKKLSDRRARACADYFIRGGIEARRITFESFGECCPLEMEMIDGRDNPDGRSRNRRALINITKE